MNHTHDDQKKEQIKEQKNTSMLEDDLQADKQQQNSAKLRRDDEAIPE